MVLFAQGDDERAGGILLGLGAGPGPGGEEEGGLGVMAEVVAKDAEGGRGVAESAGDLVRGAVIDEVGPEGLVLALPGQGGFEEESTWVCECEWCSVNQNSTMSHTPYSVNVELHPQGEVWAREHETHDQDCGWARWLNGEG